MESNGLIIWLAVVLIFDDGGYLKMDNCNFTNAQRCYSMFINSAGYNFTMNNPIFNWNIGLYVESVTIPLLHARSRYNRYLNMENTFILMLHDGQMYLDDSSPLQQEAMQQICYCS